MNYKNLWLLCVGLVLLSSCTSGTLSVDSVTYQSLRTEFSQPKSISEDAKIAVEYFFNTKGEMQPVIFNLTSEILMVDQTKSFVIMPDGSSVSYYDPTVYTTTKGTHSSETNGSSFNLGAVTAALGIGGPLGALASGTTLGSSHTTGSYSQNTVSISDQPQVFIGPKGSIGMSKTYTITGIGFSSPFVRYSHDTRNNYIDVKRDNSPVKFSVCITYSLDQGESYEKLVTNFYINSSITYPIANKKVSEAFYNIYKQKPDALAENMYLFVMPNNISTATTGLTGDFITHSDIYSNYIYGSLIDFQ